MNEQNKRERVIRALKCRSQSEKRFGNPCEETGACEYAYLITDPDGEPYYPFLCNKEKLCNDAIELLKAQEPRVLTLDELRSLNGTDHFVWLEDNGGYTLNGGYALYDCYAEVVAYRKNVELNIFGSEVELEPDNEEYGKTWRCWTAKPTKEQREATPWTE